MLQRIDRRGENGRLGKSKVRQRPQTCGKTKDGASVAVRIGMLNWSPITDAGRVISPLTAA
jgi:hypothetical protein